MKKFASPLFALLLVLTLHVTAVAQTYAVDAGVYVVDEAGILSAEKCGALNDAAAAVSEEYGCGVYIVAVGDMADYIDPCAVNANGESGMAAFSEYAWEALELDSDGIMLALSMADRDFELTAHGEIGNAAFTDYGKYLLQDEFLDNFREDDWYGGFADYIDACGRYLEANANGTPIDVEPEEPLTFGEKLGSGLLIGMPVGLLAAFIVCGIYKRQLKSVSRASGAARYALDGGAHVTAREDRFTHTTEVRTPIRTESGPKGGGGSGFHGGTTVNSGGYSHSGGKF